MRRKEPLSRQVARSARRFWDQVQAAFLEDIVLLSLVIILVFAVVTLVLFQTWPDLQENYWPGVFVEFHGLLFDIAVFGVFIGLFIRITERRRETRRQQEIIDDFKKWDSDEARYRIAGAIRRLIRLRKTDIDFGGVELRDFSFRNRDIKSIKGSSFYDGTWGEMGSRDQVVLERVDFSFVDCQDVIFSAFNPFSGLFDGFVFARLKDCNFVEAKLSNARFTGATLEWTTPPPEELGTWHDLDDGEAPTFEQTHYPPFHGADLTDVAFAHVAFKNADFRKSENILTCDFAGAKGLETCVFDDEKIRDAVLTASREAKLDDGKAAK